MYVAVKGGEAAIENAHTLMAETRRGNPDVPELSAEQIREQLRLCVDRVMAEGGLYDPDLAALAVKQACGDLVEAIFLLRAYRTTLPRFGSTCPLETRFMDAGRRISAVYKDIPGGQVLGATFDYTHRLLDFDLATEKTVTPLTPGNREETSPMTRVTDLLRAEGLLREDDALEEGGHPAEASVGDLTREPLRIPAKRDVRMQALARGDEGFLLSMGYSFQRGYGGGQHPFAAEMKSGEVTVSFVPEEVGFPLVIGEVALSECVMVAADNNTMQRPALVTGYGLAFGENERKTMSMALVDLAMQDAERTGRVKGPVQDQEFVLFHADNVEAAGFTSHLKLPHYVDFQSEIRELRNRQSHWDQFREGEGTPLTGKGKPAPEVEGTDDDRV